MKLAALFLTILYVSLSSVHAHSNLRYPLSYHKHQCNARLGCAPCPRTSPSKKRNSVLNPAAVWHRGQSVTIEWHRNNHLDGFYRRTLVPVAAAFNLTAHDKMAFDWGCWTQGSFKCKSDHCGGDKRGIAFKGPMTVPTVLPDGDYLFVQTWFGGSDRSNHPEPEIPKALFSNFAACSHVRIQGGPPQGEEFRKMFTPGDQEKERSFEDDDTDLKPSQCWSTASRVNQCGGIACNGTVLQAMTPDVFAQGNEPVLTRKAVDSVLSQYPSPTITPSSSPSPTPLSPTKTPSPSRSTAPLSPTKTPSPSQSTTPRSPTKTLSPSRSPTPLYPTKTPSPSRSTLPRSPTITPSPSRSKKPSKTTLPAPTSKENASRNPILSPPHPSTTPQTSAPPIPKSAQLNSPAPRTATPSRTPGIRASNSPSASLTPITTNPPSTQVESMPPTASPSSVIAIANPSNLPLASISPTASTTPSATSNANPRNNGAETILPTASSVPVLASSSIANPSQNIARASTLTSSFTASPIMISPGEPRIPSPTVTPNIFRETTETSVPVPSESNEEYGRSSVSTVTVSTSQGPYEPSTEQALSPSVSNVVHPPIIKSRLSSRAAAAPSRAPSDKPPSPASEGSDLWTTGTNRWSKQCGIYRACIVYCEQHVEQCQSAQGPIFLN